MAKKAFSIADFVKPEDVSNLDTAPQVEMIDIDLIDSNDKNFYELRDLKPLADSIAMDGLQQFPLVVTSPDDPKRVQLISGHRRCAAIRMLVEDIDNPREDLRLVPCVRKTYTSPAMAELQLILANSTARVLTSAETMRQAERVEMLLYELKEQGHDFPGRMRDHVAEACQVSASKLGRLKVIRDKLEPEFMEAFEAGVLSEDAAYKIAQLMDADIQHFVITTRLQSKRKIDLNIPANVAENIANRLKEFETADAPECDVGVCTGLESKKRHIAKLQNSWESKCERCCLDCCYRSNCADACTKQADKKKIEADRERKKQEKLEKERKKEGAKCAADNRKFAKRLIDMFAGDFEEISELLGYAYRKEEMEKALNGECEWSGFGRPSMYTALNISDKTGVSIDYIYGRSDYPVPYTGEWRRAEDPPENGTYAWVQDKSGCLKPSVYFRDKFMEYEERSTGNYELPGVEWWMPIAPLPGGCKFNGEETIHRMCGKEG